MATARKGVSAIAGVSLVSVLLLTFSYMNLKSSRSMQSPVSIEGDLISSGASVDQTIIFQSRKYLAARRTAPRSDFSKTSFTIDRHNLTFPGTKGGNAIILPKDTMKNKFIQSSSQMKSKSVGTEGEDSDYNQVSTTMESPQESSIMKSQPVVLASKKEIEERPYRAWLYKDPKMLPYNASLVSQQQVERHQLIRETCKRPDVKKYIFGASKGHRSLISTHKHILFCPILKAGSTNILRLLCWLRGPPCSNIKNLKPHNMVPRYLTRGNKIASGNTAEFLKYFSFALVRNPWKRLVSVYIQKFVETRQGLGFCGVKTRLPGLFKYFKKHRDEPMKFTDYLEKCVIGQHKEGGILAQNGHWRPQYHMCSFCDLDFTFIGKIETMKSDERVILNAFGFEDIDQTIADANSHLLPNEKANKTSILYEDLWNAVSQDTLNYLKGLYRIDMEMFDYPDHPLDD